MSVGDPQRDAAGGIAAEGWEGLETAQAPDARAATQPQEDLDRLIARVLGSAEGKKLLAHLRATYVEPAVCQPGVSADFGFYREGQRFVVIDLETRLNRALKPENDNGRSQRSRRSGNRQDSRPSKDPGDIPF
jgi:hypothetical protein